MFGSVTGLRIITDLFAYSETKKVCGIPAVRKPNCYRPIYLRVTFYCPLMFKVANHIICHPSLLEPIKAIAEGRSTGFGKDMSWVACDLPRGIPVSVARRLRVKTKRSLT